jgi:uncharacterized protein with WD repeat
VAQAAQSAEAQQEAPASRQEGANELENEQDVKEKKIRALKKKIRQCEQLEEKKSSGTTLTPEQVAKLNSLETLCAFSSPPSSH